MGWRWIRRIAMRIPRIHLAIMQPSGYVHSLGFLDQARFFRWQFRRLGAQVTLAKNRLREDAVNLVFGAHLGFPAAWAARHDCVIVNLEQLGQGGAQLPPEYLALLRDSAVIDYDDDNLPAYAPDPTRVVVLPYGPAPYLQGVDSPALEDRPIDLLFFGSMNARRRAFFERVEAAGVTVSCFDQPVYAEERDAFIRQAKAVLNCHFYDTSRFEQARAFQCLSLGTPVISERGPLTRPAPAFEDSVFWLGPDEGAIETFFGQYFGSAAFFAEARRQLDAFGHQDVLPPYADALALAAAVQARHDAGTREPWQPKLVNLGSGKDYKPGWLNIDILDRAEPDLVLDLGRPQTWPLRLRGCAGADVLLQAGSLETLYANNVLEHVPDLPCLMGNALTLLQPGGRFVIEVPYERALTAWQDPTHLRALNENSWVYYIDWFWYLGWFEHRFELAEFKWLDLQHKLCAKEQASFMHVVLRKIETTLRERTNARAMRADFGGLADDALPMADLRTLPVPTPALHAAAA